VVLVLVQLEALAAALIEPALALALLAAAARAVASIIVFVAFLADFLASGRDGRRATDEE
jgi:hypothetical protein